MNDIDDTTGLNYKNIKAAVKAVDFAEPFHVELSTDGATDVTDVNDVHDVHGATHSATLTVARAPAQSSAPPSTPTPLNGGFKARFPLKAPHEQPASEGTSRNNLSVVPNPTFNFGIVLSIMMAISCLIGAAEPLHAILLASGFNIPYIPHTVGFLDLFFILLVAAMGSWSFSTCKLAAAFTYKSNISRKVQLAITLVTSLVNPVVLGSLMLLIGFLMELLRPHNQGGLESFLVVLVITVLWLLHAIVVAVIPCFTAFWNYRLMRRVTDHVTATNHDSRKKRLPALIVVCCHLLPLPLFALACACLPAVLNFPLSDSTSYSHSTMVFSISLLLALFTSAIGQAVSFYVLKRTVKDIDVLKHPADFE